eukprot:TRINITY_DN5543_c0_g1_i12.p1 TRINITY_DN5543_c0_g1~~TRINITY_DN5543_c0_g1_i12.p1  ORF type:complete len:228 (+),score=34.27 TRINITY_DN5543_c0_g1_i12:322-1005(+)
MASFVSVSASPYSWLVRIAHIIWQNTKRYVNLMPDTLRYLIDILCKTLNSENEKEAKTKILKNVLGYILFRKAVDSALGNTFEYDIFENCIIPSAYTQTCSIPHILHSLVTGTLHPAHDLLSIANEFVKNSQYVCTKCRGEVESYIESYCTFKKVEETKEEGMVYAQGMCLTLDGLQIIFDVIVNDFEYFEAKYAKATRLIRMYWRLMAVGCFRMLEVESCLLRTKC